jgi:hypothetical protein
MTKTRGCGLEKCGTDVKSDVKLAILFFENELLTLPVIRVLLPKPKLFVAFMTPVNN